MRNFVFVMAKEQILVRITGKDRTGLTASIMTILAKYDAEVLDIGQADIHSTLSLGILFRIDDGSAARADPIRLGLLVSP